MNMTYLKDVVSLVLNTDKCTGCGLCREVCPHGVFALEGRRARVLDRDACMECGACRMNCPAGAIEVTAGVGCAWAILNGILHGTPPSCGCGETSAGTGCDC